MDIRNTVDKTDKKQGIDFAKSNFGKECKKEWFLIIGSLIIDSNFNILYPMVVTIWQC